MEVIGLIGFIISGITFMISSVKNGDNWALSGSIIWILSCILWLIPYFRKK